LVAVRAHVIRRAVVEVNAPAAADAFGFQQEVARWTEDRLRSRLDAIVAALPETDVAIRIDRLELEIRCASAFDWTDEALAHIESELTEAFRHAWKSAGSSGGKVGAIPHLQSFYDVLEAYLETGTLPWNCSIRSDKASSN
jgi:hypothetical protein